MIRFVFENAFEAPYPSRVISCVKLNSFLVNTLLDDCPAIWLLSLPLVKWQKSRPSFLMGRQIVSPHYTTEYIEPFFDSDLLIGRCTYFKSFVNSGWASAGYLFVGAGVLGFYNCFTDDSPWHKNLVVSHYVYSFILNDKIGPKFYSYEQAKEYFERLKFEGNWKIEIEFKMVGLVSSPSKVNRPIGLFARVYTLSSGTVQGYELLESFRKILVPRLESEVSK